MTDLVHICSRKHIVLGSIDLREYSFELLLQFSYELDNGQIFSEAGGLKTVGVEQPVVVVSGSYSFVGPDGQTYWVNYTADENGFHPVIGKWRLAVDWCGTHGGLMYFFSENSGTGAGGIQGGQDASIDPNALKSLIG